MIVRFDSSRPAATPCLNQSARSLNGPIEKSPITTYERLQRKLFVLAQNGAPWRLAVIEHMVDLMLNKLTVVVAVVALSGLLVCAAESVTVHVFTAHDASGLTDDATAARLKAVEDMKTRLAKNRNVTLVEDPAAAKIAIEVTGAGAEEGKNRTVATTTVVAGTAITNPGTALPDYVGRAIITSGTFKTTIESSLGPFGRTYGENLARKFEEWLKKNAAVLVK